jgi:hypothetical protein
MLEQRGVEIPVLAGGAAGDLIDAFGKGARHEHDEVKFVFIEGESQKEARG